MPRSLRRKSSTGMYHVILRGINKQVIFHDELDYRRFLEVLQEAKEKSGFAVHAYCIMNNHVHILIEEKDEPLSVVMKRIGSSYVYWYNRRYDRVGHLFQGRYRSQPIDDARYLLTVLRYIHQNPVKAKIKVHCKDYRWSSYREYLYTEDRKAPIHHGILLTETGFMLDLFAIEGQLGLERFKEFHRDVEAIPKEDEPMDIEEEYERPFTDEEAGLLICSLFGIPSCTVIKDSDKIQRKNYLARLKKEGLPIRQIARLTGIHRSTVQRA
ncbi:transposase [Isachenkonia alkalipeptolytica]|uniref:Transposase n=1 Tax=Isachenkonia alkalipeptolytica TaxID=2565777 RepID=A0AA43XKY2_9CLOT|nr:transposase [Isachenkonia alkalipeptolytica]NBG88276.1 transposase [Isachenkonia alkalipeptolytica]